MNQIRENYLALVNNVLELLSTQNKPAEFFILRDDGLSKAISKLLFFKNYRL